MIYEGAWMWITRDLGSAYQKEQRLFVTDTYDLRECAGTCHAQDLEDACSKKRRVRVIDTHDLRGYISAYRRTQDLTVDGACRKQTSTALVATGPRRHLLKEAAPVCHQHTILRGRVDVHHTQDPEGARHTKQRLCVIDT